MTTLVLGGTGKTGRRVATLLRSAGHDVRTAARSGADVTFDWDDPTGHDAALDGVDRVYLVVPGPRGSYAPVVTAFLDRAEAHGVQQVTLLSARGVEYAPPEAAARAVELDVARRGFSHTILRPAFFTQNVTEGAFSGPVAEQGVLALPAGDGTEAFIDADDIAAAAAATLADPAAHAGAEYELTGPEALTHAELAAAISTATGRTVRYVDARSGPGRSRRRRSDRPAAAGRGPGLLSWPRRGEEPMVARELRVSDADRDAVARRLGRALRDGRLSVEEFDERCRSAYAARTRGDLDDLVQDLPADLW